jgi:dTDP-4-amino-4,6-dideoxygalactose transaminase
MSFPFSTRAPFRLLAPAGGFASPSAIFNAWIAVRQTLKESNHKESTIAEFLWVLEDCLRRYFGVREVLCVGSGKEALWFFYNMLARSDSRGVIAMSAYTCPDIAAAAIRSGHKVLAVDVDPKTLEPMFESISESYEKSISSLVLSNLYGLVDTLPSELVTTRLSPSAIVDDACQAALSDTPHGKVGARTGCYGVVSFGRGKALGGVGGGALLLPQTQFAKELKEEFALDLTGDSIRYTIR